MGLKISVIIPNYNHAPFLKQRIDSVINQTYQEFEIIILDDCSTDSSREVMEQYRQHAKVSHIVYNEGNSGSTFKQWQKGIGLAKEDIIWIAESDDYAHPRFLERMISVLNDHPDVGFVYCNTHIIMHDGTFDKNTYADIRNIIYKTTKWNKSHIKDGKEEIKENLLINCTVNNVSGVLFRKQALWEIGIVT
jgi:glycosyltransferase involved in cell wall biosynthesis